MIVSIINQQGHNFGDEAAGAALISALFGNSQIEEIHVFYASDSPLPIKDKRIVHHIDCSLRNIGIVRYMRFLLSFSPAAFVKRTKNEYLKAYYNTIAASDHVFMAPCGASIGIYKDWRYLLRMMLVTKLGKKPIFHYNTIGKSGSCLFDCMAKKLLKKSDVNVREKQSAAYLNRIKIENTIGPDTAFLLDKREIEKSGNIVFIPAHLDDWHPFFKKNRIDAFVESELLRQVAEWASQSGHRIEILPHMNTDSERQYCQKVCDLLLQYGVDGDHVFVKPVRNYTEYDDEIAGGSIVIGMRYHAIVLAAKNGVPFVDLSYENKMREVADYTGQAAFCVDLTDPDQEAIRRALDRCLIAVSDEHQKAEEALLRRSGVLKEDALALLKKYNLS